MDHLVQPSAESAQAIGYAMAGGFLLAVALLVVALNLEAIASPVVRRTRAVIRAVPRAQPRAGRIADQLVRLARTATTVWARCQAATHRGGASIAGVVHRLTRAQEQQIGQPVAPTPSDGADDATDLPEPTTWSEKAQRSPPLYSPPSALRLEALVRELFVGGTEQVQIDTVVRRLDRTFGAGLGVGLLESLRSRGVVKVQRDPVDPTRLLVRLDGTASATRRPDELRVGPDAQ